MKLVIDRFEGDFAVCEIQIPNMIHIKKSELPEQAEEGSVLILDVPPVFSVPCGDAIKLDEQETMERAARIQKKMDDLWK